MTADRTLVLAMEHLGHTNDSLAAVDQPHATVDARIEALSAATWPAAAAATTKP